MPPQKKDRPPNYTPQDTSEMGTSRPRGRAPDNTNRDRNPNINMDEDDDSGPVSIILMFRSVMHINIITSIKATFSGKLLRTLTYQDPLLNVTYNLLLIRQVQYTCKYLQFAAWQQSNCRPIDADQRLYKAGNINEKQIEEISWSGKNL